MLRAISEFIFRLLGAVEARLPWGRSERPLHYVPLPRRRRLAAGWIDHVPQTLLYLYLTQGLGYGYDAAWPHYVLAGLGFRFFTVLLAGVSPGQLVVNAEIIAFGDGIKAGWGRRCLRCAGWSLSAVTFLELLNLGFMLFRSDRRSLADLLAGTAVIDAGAAVPADWRGQTGAVRLAGSVAAERADS